MDEETLKEQTEQLVNKSVTLKEKMDRLERKMVAVRGFADIGAFMAESKTVTQEAYIAYLELKHWLFEVDK